MMSYMYIDQSVARDLTSACDLLRTSWASVIPTETRWKARKRPKLLRQLRAPLPTNSMTRLITYAVVSSAACRTSFATHLHECGRRCQILWITIVEWADTIYCDKNHSNFWLQLSETSTKQENMDIHGRWNWETNHSHIYGRIIIRLGLQINLFSKIIG